MDSTIPAMPESAAAVWLEVFPLLNAMRVLRASDRRALRRYCLLSGRFEDVFNTTMGEDGLATLTALSGKLDAMEKQFGMTPSSRSSIMVTPEKKEGKGKFIKLGAPRSVPPAEGVG